MCWISSVRQVVPPEVHCSGGAPTSGVDLRGRIPYSTLGGAACLTTTTNNNNDNDNDNNNNNNSND